MNIVEIILKRKEYLDVCCGCYVIGVGTGVDLSM